MRPYLSIDIETTGLNREKSEVLEIGFIADDLVSNINSLPFKNMLLDIKQINYAEPFALKMNAKLIEEICNPAVEKVSVAQSFKELMDATVWLGEVCYQWDLKYAGDPKWATKKVCYCGKNAATFDVPVLKNFFLRNGIGSDAVEAWSKLVHHRVMDVGSMYFPKFGSVPSLSDINKLTGRTEVSHRAIDDALDVVYAVRHILGVNNGGKKN